MIRKAIYFVLLLFVLVDLGYSFIQHYGAPLDGDIAANIVPQKDMGLVLESPLGLNAIINDEKYPNPNRFFCHWSFQAFLINTPLFFQKYVDPIDSIYLSCAVAKTFIQLCLIFLISIAITGTANILRMDFVVASALVTPFFQTFGYSRYMGIIDPSITYTFFYALPSALLILYFLPLINQKYHGIRMQSTWVILILWIPLGLVCSLSGPLNTGVVLVVACITLIWNTRASFLQSRENGIINRGTIALKNIPSNYWLYLAPISLCSIYSLYLGQYNSNNDLSPISLSELYFRLPQGLYYQITQKLGFPILLATLVINIIIISRTYSNSDGKKIIEVLKWIGLFAIVYIILLPLGGYREYRFNTLRYDSIMPITLMLFFAFGITTIFILKIISKTYRILYYPLILAVIFIFTYADEPNFEHNSCERAALEEISKSPSSVVRVSGNCSILSWYVISEPEDSDIKAELLHKWNVTKNKKLYYH